MGAHDRPMSDYAGIVELQPQPIDLLGRPSHRTLVRFAARHWGVRVELLFGKSRDSLVVAARHHAMWLIRTHTTISLQRIGKLFGGRDHATVLNGIDSHMKRMAGIRPVPFIWTPQRAHTVMRFARTGATLGETVRNFNLHETDLLRHPHYAQLRRHAREALSLRVVQRYLARGTGAHQ